jgi:hypothetical protein
MTTRQSIGIGRAPVGDVNTKPRVPFGLLHLRLDERGKLSNVLHIAAPIDDGLLLGRQSLLEIVQELLTHPRFFAPTDFDFIQQLVVFDLARGSTKESIEELLRVKIGRHLAVGTGWKRKTGRLGSGGSGNHDQPNHE